MSVNLVMEKAALAAPAAAPVTIALEESTTRLFERYSAGLLRAHGLDRIDGDALVAAQPVPDASGVKPDDVSGAPRIAVWRQAYRDMGLKSSDYRASIEQLVRRQLQGGLPKTGLWSVDLYNIVSVRHLAPFGGYDLDTLPERRIAIRAIDPARDHFTPLAQGKKGFALTPSIVAYASGDEILCWAINHRDAAPTVLRAATSDALFVSEAVDEQGRAASRDALEELRAVLAAAGAQCSPVAFVDRRNPEATM
jgi:DNA/RNA-binding domain of Phe-tRNA-synthetase-like protein